MIPSEEVSVKKKKNHAIEIYNFFPFTLANAKIDLFLNLYLRIKNEYVKLGAIDSYIELRKNIIDFDEKRNLFVLESRGRIYDMFEDFIKDYSSGNKRSVKEQLFYFEMTCPSTSEYLDEHELLQIKVSTEEFSLYILSENLNKYIAQGLPKALHFEANEFEVISYFSYKHKQKTRKGTLYSKNLFRVTLVFERYKEVF